MSETKELLDRFYEKGHLLLGGQRVSTVLLEARELLRHSYCRGVMALDPRSKPVTPSSEEAVCWSMDGAIAKSCNQLGLIPSWLFTCLDHLVYEFALLRGLEPVDCSWLPPLAAFADNAHWVNLLEFLTYASLIIEEEGY